MPGTFCSRAPSWRETAPARSATDMPESTDSAVRGPMPLILTSSRKVWRSSALRKP
jgi:hypothetical protein